MKRAVEPARKSLLDVVRRNLRAAQKMTYITRIVYIGEYTGAHISIEEKMETVIHRMRRNYASVPITGLFLVYPSHYVHVLEATEDIIYRHFTALYDDKCTNCEVGRAILLPTYHHVHRRFFTDWFYVYTVPPSLIQKLESYEIEDIIQHVTNCYNKIYSLCDRIAKAIREDSIPGQDVVKTMGDKLTRLYPESTLIEYLLSARSPVLMTADEYLKTCTTVPLIKLYSGNNISHSTLWHHLCVLLEKPFNSLPY